MKISRMLRVTPNSDHTLLIEFEYGNRILFNMEGLLKTMPYRALSDPECFQSARIDGKAICWDTDKPGHALIPLRLTVDNILFAIRDA